MAEKQCGLRSVGCHSLRPRFLRISGDLGLPQLVATIRPWISRNLLQLRPWIPHTIPRERDRLSTNLPIAGASCRPPVEPARSAPTSSLLLEFCLCLRSSSLAAPLSKHIHSSHLMAAEVPQEQLRDLQLSLRRVLRDLTPVDMNRLHDYEHRGEHPLRKDMALYVYSMWVRRVEKKDDAHATRHVLIPFCPSYALAASHVQAISLWSVCRKWMDLPCLRHGCLQTASEKTSKPMRCSNQCCIAPLLARALILPRRLRTPCRMTQVCTPSRRSILWCNRKLH